MIIPLWKRLGFKSVDDYLMLERATRCGRCNKPLPKWGRWRLRDATGLRDIVVCTPCKPIMEKACDSKGESPITHYQGRLL